VELAKAPPRIDVLNQSKSKTQAALNRQPARAGLRKPIASNATEIAACRTCVWAGKSLVVEDVVDQEAGLQIESFRDVEGPGDVAVHVVHSHRTNSVDTRRKYPFIVAIGLASWICYETTSTIRAGSYSSC